jgi:hypothetical protein
MQDLMPDKRIDDLKQRALTTLHELNTSSGAIAETLRPYRIHHVENMIEALRDYALASETDEGARSDAQRAITEISGHLRRVTDK